MDWTNRIRLRHLQVLNSLASTRNISHSAEHLCMTQPAVSKWLKELEADIGLQLFERHARGLTPTEFGKSLCGYAARITNELDRARDEMEALRNGSSGRAIVGASGAAIAAVMPRAVLKLLSIMPNADIKILEAPMDRLFQQLVNREIDIALGRPLSKYTDPDVLSEVLYQERLHFVARPSHPLTSCDALTWADLTAHKWVVWTKDIPVRELLNSAMSDANVAVPTRGCVQSNSLLATVALVSESDMIALVSESAIELHERWKSLARLSLQTGLESEVTVYWRRDGSDAGAVAGMLDALRVSVLRNQ